jgi:general secretion pathway protein D
MSYRAACGALRLVLIAMAVAPLAACQTPLLEVLTPLAAPAKLQSAEPRVNSAIPGDRRQQTSFEARGSAVEPALAPQRGTPASQAGDITLNFVDTDIREIARTILGTMLKLNFTIDPNVHGTASIETGTPVARSALLPTLETVLNQNGATLIEKNGLYVVVPTAAAGVTNAVAGANAPGAGTQVVALRYAAAKDLAKLLEPYVGEGGKIAPDAGRNALIISGDAAVRQSLVGLIRAFDIDILAGQSFALFPTGDGDATKIAAGLEKVLQTGGESPLEGVVRVVPMPRVNAVLVVSSQPRYPKRRSGSSASRAGSKMPRREAGTSITYRTARAPISKTCCNAPSRRATSAPAICRAGPHPAPNRCR